VHECEWVGSHRYAVMNLCAADEARLRARYEAICKRFGWPAMYWIGLRLRALPCIDDQSMPRGFGS
jgi:hypothetical protein